VTIDYQNQPGDVVAVIEALLDGADPIRDHLDEGEVGVAGHSLGAITAIGLGYNSCCADDRVVAVMEVSGIKLPFPEGDFDDPPPLPLLAVHGAKDSTVPVTGSDALVADATGPSHYLRFPEGGHVDVLFGDTAALVDDAAVAFFDRYLKADTRRFDDLTASVDASGIADLTERGT
jgi:predicted dienelactone hydrolase